MLSQLSPQLSCLLPALGFITIILYKWFMKKRTPPLPPGLTGYPIIGCLPQMTKNKPGFRWMHQLMQDMKTEIACFRIGKYFIVTVSSPELARDFLKKHDAILLTRPIVTSIKVIRKSYPASIFFSLYGDQWKKMKKVLASEFIMSSVSNRYLDRRRDEANEVIRHVYNQCQSPLDNGVVNVRTISQFYCANVLKRVIFNKRFSSTKTKDGCPGVEDSEHLDAVFKALTYLFGFALADFLPWLAVFDFDGHEKNMSDAIETMKKYQGPEIDARIEMWQKGVRKTEDDILDRMINLKDSNNNPLLTTEEIKSQINEIMLASIDNPSNVVEWCLAEMITDPTIFDKARKELDRVVGVKRLVEESDLPKLNYIKACAREALRLHPISAFNLPHVSSEDIVVGGYLIPKGSQVLLSRIGLGLNPRVWEDPLKYNPDRHIAENQGVEKVVTLEEPQLRMISFSTGRRSCPGNVLGSYLATFLLARLIHGFDWTMPSDGQESIELVECVDGNLLMKKPLIVRATPRLEPEVYLQAY